MTCGMNCTVLGCECVFWLRRHILPFVALLVFVICSFRSKRQIKEFRVLQQFQTNQTLHVERDHTPNEEQETAQHHVDC